MVLIYREIRKLAIDPASHPRGLSFLSAASGLVRVGERLYVVADDENHLGVFDAAGNAPGRLIRLFDGDLPESVKKRKAQKPDLEALLLLPATAQWPAGALLALGSGSRPSRFTGALLKLDEHGEAHGPARAIDLEPLYDRVNARFAELNIEGAFIAGDALLLLQRGSMSGPNGVVRFPLEEVMAWLNGAAASLQPSSFVECDLGGVDGVPFAFTDGAALADGAWLFSAVAERTDNSYDDGACLAAAIGVADRDGSVRAMHRLDPTRKVEGIEAQVRGGTITIGMVTDADDPAIPAELGVTTL
jgi:hypothetical protein